MWHIFVQMFAILFLIFPIKRWLSGNMVTSLNSNWTVCSNFSDALQWRFRGRTGSTVGHGSIAPGFKPRPGYIRGVFHLVIYFDAVQTMIKSSHFVLFPLCFTVYVHVSLSFKTIEVLRFVWLCKDLVSLCFIRHRDWHELRT